MTGDQADQWFERLDTRWRHTHAIYFWRNHLKTYVQLSTIDQTVEKQEQTRVQSVWRMRVVFV